MGGNEATLVQLKRTELYSEQLGIKLSRRTDAEYFKWFLASLLFGARISETIARQTYESFAARGLLTPQSIIRATKDYLVSDVMRAGGYARFDERKSTQVLGNCEMLLADCGGSLSKLHDRAQDAEDLEKRLLAFDGVGPVTVNIFLRELRPYWKKADPDPLPVVLNTARTLRLDLDEFKRKALSFARIEAGLIRMHKQGQSRTRARLPMHAPSARHRAPRHRLGGNTES